METCPQCNAELQEGVEHTCAPAEGELTPEAPTEAAASDETTPAAE